MTPHAKIILHSGKEALCKNAPEVRNEEQMRRFHTWVSADNIPQAELVFISTVFLILQKFSFMILSVFSLVFVSHTTLHLSLIPPSGVMPPLKPVLALKTLCVDKLASTLAAAFITVAGGQLSGVAKRLLGRPKKSGGTRRPVRYRNCIYLHT